MNRIIPSNRWLLLVIVSVVAAGFIGQTQSAGVDLHVIDRGANDSPIPGVAVDVFDSKRNRLEEGLTDSVGVYPIRKFTPGQTLTIEYQKVGYLRRPETRTVATSSTVMKVEGPLVRVAADKAYYIALGRGIDRAVERWPQTQADELARVKALPKDSYQIVVSSMKTAAFGSGTKTGQEDGSSRSKPTPAPDVK